MIRWTYGIRRLFGARAARITFLAIITLVLAGRALTLITGQPPRGDHDPYSRQGVLKILGAELGQQFCREQFIPRFGPGSCTFRAAVPKGDEGLRIELVLDLSSAPDKDALIRDLVKILAESACRGRSGPKLRHVDRVEVHLYEPSGLLINAVSFPGCGS